MWRPYKYKDRPVSVGAGHVPPFFVSTWPGPSVLGGNETRVSFRANEHGEWAEESLG
jgi:hypothetical protein